MISSPQSSHVTRQPGRLNTPCAKNASAIRLHLEQHLLWQQLVRFYLTVRLYILGHSHNMKLLRNEHGLFRTGCDCDRGG
jgi:hypothetical protein